jgi:DNA/RNA-binding domain of Phe-tRNA-synthetase-like protein
LEALKRAVEQEMRLRHDNYTKADLAALPIMDAYREYYKSYKKTYHVLLQLRSVVLEGKSLPSVAALVEASFMAELKNGLLTAAHDLDKIREPIALDIATGDEKYIMLNGREQTLKANDMIMKDAQGVICSVIYGLDRRTAVTASTRRAMFVVYAPQGIAAETVHAHLKEIQDYVQIIAPHAGVMELHVYHCEH